MRWDPYWTGYPDRAGEEFFIGMCTIAETLKIPSLWVVTLDTIDEDPTKEWWAFLQTYLARGGRSLGRICLLDPILHTDVLREMLSDGGDQILLSFSVAGLSNHEVLATMAGARTTQRLQVHSATVRDVEELDLGEVLVVPDSGERVARAVIKLASQLQVPLGTVLRALSEQETEFWGAPGSALQLRDQREMVTLILSGE